MSKVKDFAMTLDEIIETGEELVESCKEAVSSTEVMLNAIKELKVLFDTPTPEPVPKTYTFEQVREIMATLAANGKKAEAKALLTKFGVTRLSDIKEEDYVALVSEAQVITND